MVGLLVGWSVGSLDGSGVGVNSTYVGDLVGFGEFVGFRVVGTVGSSVGRGVGSSVGSLVGLRVRPGNNVGSKVGS